jgi:RNA polymerase sigma-70 factor (ECF subfamily)
VTDEAALTQSFIERRSEALDAVYVAYAGMLYGVAYRVLEHAEDARDCVHDVLLRVWLAAHSYRAERGTLRAFLVVAVRNEALTRRRSAARHRVIEMRVPASAVAPDIANDIADAMESQRLRRAIATLPPEHRSVFERVYLRYQTQAEAARELGIPIGTVKSRIANGLQKLHAALQPEAQPT